MTLTHFHQKHFPSLIRAQTVFHHTVVPKYPRLVLELLLQFFDLGTGFLERLGGRVVVLLVALGLFFPLALALSFPLVAPFPPPLAAAAGGGLARVV